MDESKLFRTLMWVAIAGAAFSLFCLAASGAGDAATSFQLYLLCSAIIIGSSMIALALLHGRKD